MVLLFCIIIITQIFYEEITVCEIKRYPNHYYYMYTTTDISSHLILLETSLQFG